MPELHFTQGSAMNTNIGGVQLCQSAAVHASSVLHRMWHVRSTVPSLDLTCTVCQTGAIYKVCMLPVHCAYILLPPPMVTAHLIYHSGHAWVHYKEMQLFEVSLLEALSLQSAFMCGVQQPAVLWCSKCWDVSVKVTSLQQAPAAKV